MYNTINYQTATDLITSGKIWIIIPLCLLAGLFSFASPCIIPLIPGYIAYFTALSANTIQTNNKKHTKRKIRKAVILFIAGYTSTYIATTIIVVQLALRFNQKINPFNNNLLEILGGIFIILMGLIFCGVFKIFQTEKKLSYKFDKLAIWGALPAGITFALSWTPCTGPILSALITLTLTENNTTLVKATIYVICYCLGLGIPFLILATGSIKAQKSYNCLKKHRRSIQLTGGIILIIIGILLVIGKWENISHLIISYFPHSQSSPL